MISVVKNLQ